ISKPRGLPRPPSSWSSSLSCLFNQFVTTKAIQDIDLWSTCSSNEINPNSTNQSNIGTLLSYLSSNSTSNKEFYNTALMGTNGFETRVGGDKADKVGQTVIAC
ncbi:hypothetical protein L195_g050389, partial [Trifolium pratense]